MSNMTNQMMLYDAANDIPIELLALKLTAERKERLMFYYGMRTKCLDYSIPKAIYDVNDAYDKDNISDNDLVLVCFATRYDDIRDFSINTISKYDSLGFQSSEIVSFIKKFNEQFNSQQHTTTLLFDGREPRKDILKKLYQIAEVIEYEYQGYIGSLELLRKIVHSTLGKPDSRTFKKYMKTLVDYAHSYKGIEHAERCYYYYFNGFLNLVQKKLDKLS